MKLEMEELSDESQHMIKKIEWSQAAVLELIDIWSEHICLYNSKNNLYYNKHARAVALEDIAAKLQQIMPNMTVHEVKTKIKYLRSQYGRELMKMRESQKNGACDEDAYIPGAYWFKHLHFLKEFVTYRKGKFNHSYVENDNDNDNDTSLSEEDDIPTTSIRSKIYWTQTAVLKLIDIWAVQDGLYNPKHPLYHNKQARTIALKKMAANVRKIIPNMTVEEVKIKINYLRTQYCRELVKIRESQNSGVCNEKLYTPTAYWFEQLNFLKDFVSLGKGKSNHSNADNDNDTSLSEEEDISKPSKRRRKYDENSCTELNESRKAKHQSSNEEVLTIAKNYLLNIKKNDVQSLEDDFLTSTLSFLRLNLLEIRDKTLRDELVEKMMLLIFEYKRKQRELE